VELGAPADVMPGDVAAGAPAGATGFDVRGCIEPEMVAAWLGAAVGPGLAAAADEGAAAPAVVGAGIDTADGVGAGVPASLTTEVGTVAGDSFKVAVCVGAVTSPVTRISGPLSGLGCGPRAAVATNVTVQLPAGSLLAACHVPSSVVPELSLRLMLLPATAAVTALASNLPPPS
jgi:hypothetical protein